MIELLFVLLALSCAFVNEKERFMASIFTGFTLAFYFINNILPDNYYYVCAAAYDLSMMLVMRMFLSVSNQDLTKWLCGACFISILIQLFGWILYATQGNGHLYNYMAFTFYIGVIALFLSRTKLNGKLTRGDSHSNRFLRDHIRGI